MCQEPLIIAKGQLRVIWSMAAPLAHPSCRGAAVTQVENENSGTLPGCGGDQSSAAGDRERTQAVRRAGRANIVHKTAVSNPNRRGWFRVRHVNPPKLSGASHLRSNKQPAVIVADCKGVDRLFSE
jgi:hypothetical protein